MKISIVTAVYNSVSTIQQTMRSVQDQEYKAVEHVIIDGKSTDGTVDVVESNLRGQDQFLSEADLGIYDAMNKGVKRATGDVVGVMGSDDYFAAPDVLSHVANAFRRSGADAVYGDLAYVRGDSDCILRFWQSGEYRPGSFALGWVPPHPAFFCKRELFDRFGYFRLDMPVAADFELLLRFIEKNHASLEYLKKTIAIMRLGGTSNRLSGIVNGNASIIRAFQLNGFGFPWLYFVCKPIRRVRQYIRPTRRATGVASR